MMERSSKERQILEVMLVLLIVGLTCLLYKMNGYKLVILFLYFLPVALGGFFLGLYRAGVTALFCVISASLVTAMSLTELTVATPPIVIALAVTVWAAVLGLTALMVGVLSDDRVQKINELHEAYVGVVEVLTQYLQSAHPSLKAQAIRIAELSQKIAATLRFSPREIDDIRVAALLYDVGNIEVTTRVIRRAVGTVSADSLSDEKRTFQGMDLMLSLGTVLNGAIPLVLNQDDPGSEIDLHTAANAGRDIPTGARIIQAARAFDRLTEGTLGEERLSADEAIAQMRADEPSPYDVTILDALERVAPHAAASSGALSHDTEPLGLEMTPID